MIIRKAELQDLDSIVRILLEQKKYLKDKGIPQWQGEYPNEDTFKNDIAEGRLYVLADQNEVKAFFALIYPDHNYDYIEDGKWLDDSKYIAVHRMAVDSPCKGKGCAGIIFDYLKSNYPHIRIDTHARNSSMIRAVTKNNFEYCGVVYMEDGTKRNAYEWLKEKDQ